LLSDQVISQNKYNNKVESFDVENVDISFTKVPQFERTKHVHGIHPYQGKFIPQLVEFLIKKNKFSSKDVILDPFMGSGTTNVECKLRHIDSIGVEISEFNCLLGKIKVSNYNIKILGDEISDFENKAKQVDYSKEIKPSEYAIPGGFAELLARSERKMKTAQLRKFFTKVKNIEKRLKGKKGELDEATKDELYLIVPELAYAVGRDELVTRRFFNIVTTIIKDKLKSVDDFRNFSRFMTALVAYKKAEEKGGR